MGHFDGPDSVDDHFCMEFAVLCCKGFLWVLVSSHSSLNAMRLVVDLQFTIGMRMSVSGFSLYVSL